VADSGWWLVAGVVRAVGMRSRASGVACLEAVAAPFIPNPRPFCSLFHGRATPDAREAHPYRATRADHRRSLGF
jgi:hypothetical protein